MRVYLESLGCRLNYAEMATLSRQLVNAGHALAASAAEADVCVLNSCAVTGEAARKSRQLARHLAQANPAARLVVTGCYATLEGEAVAALPNVSLVVDNSAKDNLLALMADAALAPPVAESAALGAVEIDRAPVAEVSAAAEAAAAAMDGPAFPPLSGEPIGRTRAFIKVQDGCHNRCTYCIVTVARGAERSRSVAEIVAEINELAAAGYQEAVLTGVHLGAYGRDSGGKLRDLVAALLADTDIPRLRLSSLEPFDLAADFFDLWCTAGGAPARLMPHLHLPAQSGCDAVLRRMARRNTVADFEALVAAARQAIPGLMVTTDLIVGFPGETEEQFAETLAFARRMGFSHIHAFPYSARAGTAAARFANQVAENERRARNRRLNALDAELSLAARQSMIGQERPVLWENRVHDRIPGGTFSAAADHDEALRAAWEGLTDNYLRVRAAFPIGQNMHNRITTVRLARITNGELEGTPLLPSVGDDARTETEERR
jgi:threonylcarbamoyladenosine tRNA methylthiotransferase MtaB